MAEPLDLLAGDHGRDRQPGAERLGQRQDVGHDAVALEGIHVAGPAQAGLRLVEDEQHAALDAHLLEPAQVADRRLDDAARGQDRLDDAGGEAARGLLVDHREAVRELALPVVGAVGVPEGRAVGVGGRQGQVARHRRPVAVAAGRERRGRGPRRHAVPRPVEGHDLVAAGGELGHLERRLVGLGSRRQQQHLAQRLGQGRGQPPGEVHDRPAQHAAVEVVERRDRLGDGADDVRVRVAEDRAHLPRGEVEDRGAGAVARGRRRRRSR